MSAVAVHAFPCPQPGCNYRMDTAGSVPAHLAMAHPEVPMDVIAPKRTGCIGGHPAWRAWICTACGKDVRGPGWKGPRTKVLTVRTDPVGGSARNVAPAADPGQVLAGVADAVLAVTTLPIDSIVIEENVREDLGELDGLVASIREHGLLQAVLVDRRADGSWRLVDGHRRLEASRLAELAEIPVQVAPKAFEAAARTTIQIVANSHRRDLSVLEEARGYQAIMARDGISQADLARRLSKDPSTISNALRLLEAPEPVLELLRAGTVNAAQVKAVLGLPEANQVNILSRVKSNGYSAHDVERDAKYQRQEIESRKKLVRENAAAIKRAIAALEASEVPKGAQVITLLPYSLDRDAIRAAIAEAGWPTNDGYGYGPHDCDCSVWRVDVNDGKGTTVERTCVSQEHANARHAAKDADRKEREAEAEAHRQELQAAVRLALEAVPPTLARLLVRWTDNYTGKTWTEYSKLARGEALDQLADRIANSHGSAPIPTAKVIAALAGERGTEATT